MTKNKTIVFIVGSSLIAVGIMFLVEQFFTISYLWKTLAKLVLFIGLPLIYARSVGKQNIFRNLNLKNNTKTLRYGLRLGLASAVIVLAAYFVFKQFIDLENILNDLETRLKITATNFILVGLYITLINSLIEELFFRGFIFLEIHQRGRPVLAYLFSAILFALYHVAIFATWFTLPITALALFGLFAVAIVFNYLDLKTNNFIPSWITHLCADAAIIGIGMTWFGII